MNAKILAGAAVAAVLAIAPAAAQPVPPVAQAAPVAPHGPDRVVTRAEVAQHVQKMFARLDTNRDGFVTKAEADAGREAMRGHMRQRFAKRLADGGVAAPHHRDRGAAFDRLDANKDGAISREEFNAAPQRFERRMVIHRQGGAPGAPGMKAMHGRMMGMRLHGRMFDMADANRDGRVSLQEATGAALRHFDMADANRDGRITREERIQMRQRMRAQRQQG